jgi:hypothetical protein
MLANTAGICTSLALVIALAPMTGCREASVDSIDAAPTLALGPSHVMQSIESAGDEAVEAMQTIAATCPVGFVNWVSYACCNAGYTGVIQVCLRHGGYCCVFEQQSGECAGLVDCGTTWANMGCGVC